MLVNELDIVIFIKPEQPWNVLIPMLVTLFGITTLFNLMQLMKVWSFKIVILLGKSTVTKLAQLLKAFDSILLTLFGIIILIKLLILLNAFEPMAVRVYTIDKYVITLATGGLVLA